MMGFKQVIDQFKQKHAQGVSLDVLPLLVNDLVSNGLDISKLDGSFYTEVAKEIYGDSNKEALGYAIEALFLLSQMVPAPKPNVQESPRVVSAPTKPAKVIDKRETAIIEDDIIKTDHLVASMPSEDEEGDPFYIPPEERIDLRPEDMAPIQYDEEYCKLLGIDPKSRKA
jgi:hypothetical protein